MTKIYNMIGLMLAALAATSALVTAYAAEPKVIDVKLGSYYIKPDKITVKENQPVTLNVTNESWMVSHDLVIKAPEAGMDFKVDLHGGKSGTVTFTPTKPGSYKMLCDKKMLFGKDHDEKGMHGVLEVTQ